MMSVDQPETFSKLSTSQQIILAILPIPSSILSIIGSTVIIYIARKSREAKGWNPYHRLLLGMSVCDIIFSITLGLNIFLLPRETSQRIWVMGNHATCSAMGFFIQFSYSALLYNAMLSFYFLLTARFGLKNDQISRRIEPIMHAICLGYPTITAWTGLFMDAYSESGMALGCWVKEYPKGCGYYGETGEECQSPMVAWIFGGSLNIFVYLSLTINNFVIWLFVHKQIKRNYPIRKDTNETDYEQESPIGEETDDNQEEAESRPSMASSFETKVQNRRKQNHKRKSTEQDRRLQLVRNQAFLFVGSYLMCNIWTMILRVFESQAQTLIEELEQPSHHFPLLLLQAWFYPLQGVLNMLVYMRPKYLKFRKAFPEESRMFAIRQALGQEPAPQDPPVNPRDTPKDPKDLVHVSQSNNESIPSMQLSLKVERDQQTYEEPIKELHTSASKRRSRDVMLSSLTASQGDFTEDNFIDPRWGEEEGKVGHDPPSKVMVYTKPLKSSLLSSIGSASDLETISEIDEIDPETLRKGGEPRWSIKDDRSQSSSNPNFVESTPAPPDLPMTMPKRTISPKRQKKKFLGDDIVMKE